MNHDGGHDQERHPLDIVDTGTSAGTAGESQLQGIQTLMQVMGPQALTQVHELLTLLQSQNQQG